MIKINDFLKKIDKIAAWVSFFLLLLFFITGWIMKGTIRIIHPDSAQYWHTSFAFIAFILFMIHPFIQFYFLIEKWKRKK